MPYGPQIQSDAGRRDASWQPPPAQVRPVYQPVEVRGEDGDWALGRINAWWEPVGGGAWCRVRTVGRGGAERWMPYDPDRLTLLATGGT